MFVAAFSGKVTILSPNLDPKARVLHVTFRLFFRPGTKRGPRGDHEEFKATKKLLKGSPAGAQGQKGSWGSVQGTVAGRPKASGYILRRRPQEDISSGVS